MNNNFIKKDSDNIFKLYQNKEYFQIVDSYFKKLDENDFNPDGKFEIYIYKYFLLSLYDCGFYYNFLDFLKKFIKKVKFKNLDDELQLRIIERTFESLLYFKINNIKGLEFNFDNGINDIICYITSNEKINSNHIKSLKKLYETYTDKKPYFEIEVFVPFSLNIVDQTFICSIEKNESIRFIEEERGIVKGSKVIYKCDGFTRTDPSWMGYNYKKRQNYHNLAEPISLINDVITNIIIHRMGGLIQKVQSNQFSSYILNQYYNGKEIFNAVNLTEFGHTYMFEWFRKKFITNDELSLIQQSISNKRVTPYYVKLFRDSLIGEYSGNYNECFVVINECLENMIEFWFFKFSEYFSIKEEYVKVTKGEIVYNETTKTFEESHSSEQYSPSLFNLSKYFYKKGKFKSKEKDNIDRLIRGIRNDNLRNDVVHGKCIEIDYDIIKNSRENLKKLNSLLNQMCKDRGMIIEYYVDLD